MSKAAIIIIGPPGSGKGTQAKLLAEKLNFFHFITSRVGKEWIASHSDPETLKQADNYGKGVLFDPPWTLKIVKEKTKEIFNKYDGIVYDGSPRTLYEAEGLFPFLTELFGKENVKVFIIEIGREELKRRLTLRLMCNKNIAHVFIRSEKLQVGFSCPENDGGILIERDLDKKELFETRMTEYEQRTVPGIEFLKKNHKAKIINGEQSIEKVHEDIVGVLRI